MSETKWTPGPWVAKNARTLSHIHQAGACGAMIGSVSRGSAECDANARLIAAAPTMAATLAQIVIECTESPNSDADRLALILDIARAALAQGQGGVT